MYVRDIPKYAGLQEESKWQIMLNDFKWIQFNHFEKCCPDFFLDKIKYMFQYVYINNYDYKFVWNSSQ